jgi:predicted CXXCH cytochrome family protein
VTGTGGQAATDVFLNYDVAVADGTEWSHPTITTGGATPTDGCNKCHDVHDPTGTATGYLLTADNTDSGFCVSCHGAAGAPAVGGNSHYIGVPTSVSMNSGLTPALPWANQIDEDGTVGADWSGATANMMVCETCHSVHRQGDQSVDGGYLLRDKNSNNQICQACHTAN